jgi:hypothetical protein
LLDDFFVRDIEKSSRPASESERALAHREPVGDLHAIEAIELADPFSGEEAREHAVLAVFGRPPGQSWVDARMARPR